MTEQAVKPPRRHGVKIREAVTDHVPVTRVWHVVECACGWSTPLCETPARAKTMYETHKRRDRKLRAA